MIVPQNQVDFHHTTLHIHHHQMHTSHQPSANHNTHPLTTSCMDEMKKNFIHHNSQTNKIDTSSRDINGTLLESQSHRNWPPIRLRWHASSCLVTSSSRISDSHKSFFRCCSSSLFQSVQELHNTADTECCFRQR